MEFSPKACLTFEIGSADEVTVLQPLYAVPVSYTHLDVYKRQYIYIDGTEMKHLEAILALTKPLTKYLSLIHISFTRRCEN